MTTTELQPMLVSIPDAASAFGITERWFRELVARGDIPTVRLGRRRLVCVKDLETFITAHRQSGTREP